MENLTAQQFYSEDGQKLQSLQYQHDSLLKRQGYYSKGVVKLSHRIVKLKEKINAKAAIEAAQ